MNRKRLPVLPAALAGFILLAAGLPASRVASAEDRETDPLVLQKLERWQDWKFGLMMHWGPYSQWGVVESWTLCSKDEPWCRRTMDNYVEYKKAYEALLRTFNPAKFDPANWAAAAKTAGMRYVVFTTKHHDGFSMFDTKETDYRVTSPDVPFHTNPKADVTKAIFDAFRKEGFETGAYFSKPDWHHPDFWAPEWATPDRNVNYSIERYPERWQRFRDFTYRQIEELVGDYGPLDVLWLDGGWVRPQPRGGVRPRGPRPAPRHRRMDEGQLRGHLRDAAGRPVQGSQDLLHLASRRDGLCHLSRRRG